MDKYRFCSTLTITLGNHANISWSMSYIDISMMCVDGSNNFGRALCILYMYEYLLTCIVFHEKEYKDKLCCAASYIEIYMIYMCICVFFLSEVAIISKLYFNLLDRWFILITIQFDIINFFLFDSNTILKNSIHIALTKSIF